MKVLQKLLIAVLVVVLFAGTIMAQCTTWNDNSQKEAAENAHVLYRQFLKGKQPAELAKLDAENFKLAFDNWKKAYEIAPAADGQRPSHYADGRKIYKAMVTRESDAAKKDEYNEVILRLYDEQAECYKNEAYLMGRKAFDMFYMPAYGYRTTTLDAFKIALEKGGNDTEYIILEPMAQVMVYLYKNKQLSQQETQKLYTQLEEIADHNIANNAKYKEYYESAKARMAAQFGEIEDEVFDCAYFKKKLVPQYREHPDDLEVIKYVYNKLRNQGCDSTEAVMVELKGKYQVIAQAINDSLEIVRRQNNPGYDAVQLQKEGKYEEAVVRYQEALEGADDPEAKAQYYYSIAFIQTWQFGQYQSAVGNARKAANLKSGWGKPYILIGDIYGKSSRSCGDDWGQRMAVLAAIDKYAYAKSIDSEVSDEANKRIGNYSSARPEKQEGFMRGVKEGQTVSVPCWIGESVKVRYRN